MLRTGEAAWGGGFREEETDEDRLSGEELDPGAGDSGK